MAENSAGAGDAGSNGSASQSLVDYISSNSDGVDDLFEPAPQSSTGSEPAGDAPAVPTDGSSVNPSPDDLSPEGDDDDGADDDGPAATDVAPDQEGQEGAATETAQPDPLATATAVNYVVNGETRNYDALRHIPGMGAVIKEADLPQLQQRLSERDHLFETSREQYKALTDLEQRTSWKVRQSDGTEKTLTGAAALEERSVVTGRALAALEELSSVLKDPAKFARLVTVDAQGNIVPDTEQLEYLLTRSQLKEQQIEQQVRAHFQSQGAIQRTATQDAQAPSGQIAVPDTFVDQYAAQLGVTGLAPDDKAILQAIAPRYIRLATSEDVMQNPTLKVGTPVIEEDFTNQLKHYAGLRAATQKAHETGAQTTTAAVQAQKENDARIAAAKTKPSTKKAASQPRDEQGKYKSDERSDKLWEMMNRVGV